MHSYMHSYMHAHIYAHINALIDTQTNLPSSLWTISRSAYHCYDCGVCVHNLDHHCPWTGKCIGRDNIKYFHAFLSMLCCQVVFIIVCTIVSVSYGNDIYTRD
jgi:hypothetical protein